MDRITSFPWDFVLIGKNAGYPVSLKTIQWLKGTHHHYQNNILKEWCAMCLLWAVRITYHTISLTEDDAVQLVENFVNCEAWIINPGVHSLNYLTVNSNTAPPQDWWFMIRNSRARSTVNPQISTLPKP